MKVPATPTPIAMNPNTSCDVAKADADINDDTDISAVPILAILAEVGLFKLEGLIAIFSCIS